MLYAGCSRCGAIDALWCNGQFGPHVPIFVEAGPGCVYCNMCGILPLVFTCMYCGTQQMLFLPGVTPLPVIPYMQPGWTPNIAPVVQARSEAPRHLLVDIFK